MPIIPSALKTAAAVGFPVAGAVGLLTAGTAALTAWIVDDPSPIENRGIDNRTLIVIALSATAIFYMVND
jgi:hypothetical protein